VAENQAFVETVDKSFDAIGNFIQMVENQQALGLSDKDLLFANDLIVQNLNMFSAVCYRTRKDQYAMDLVAHRFNTRWAKLSVDDQDNAKSFGCYMVHAMNGRKMDSFDLEGNYDQSKGGQAVNEGMGYLIQGRCHSNKRAKAVESNPEAFHEQQEAMVASHRSKAKGKGKGKTADSTFNFGAPPTQDGMFSFLRKMKSKDSSSSEQQLENSYLVRPYTHNWYTVPARTAVAIKAIDGNKWRVSFEPPHDAELGQVTVAAKYFCQDPAEIEDYYSKRIGYKGGLKK